MSNDIKKDAPQLIRTIRWIDNDGEFTLSPESCTAYVIDFVREHAIVDDQPNARQERIDATARGVFAASFGTAKSELMHRYPGGAAWEAILAADTDAAYRFAIALEAARERALLKEAK